MLWPAWMAAMRLGFNRNGNGRVADALGEVDAADAVALRGHGADLRLHGAGGKLAQRETGRGMRMRRKGFGHREAAPTSRAILHVECHSAHVLRSLRDRDVAAAVRRRSMRARAFHCFEHR